MNNSTQTLPAGFVQTAEINLKKDTRLTIILSIVALIVFALVFILLSSFTALVRPEVRNFSENITLVKMLGLLGLTVIVLIIHEIIHGLFFWVFSHSKPVFALRPMYAYAGAPNWFFQKRQYTITALAPLVIIGAAGLLLLRLAPLSWVLMIMFLVALNTGGAVGDLFVFLRLLKCSPTSFVNDTGDVVTFFERPAPVS
jgi:hypothetical protein